MTGSDDGTSSERKLIEEYQAGAGITFQSLDGSTPAKARAERITGFQAEQGDVFLISLKAGGVGLNLTAADYVIHMDRWWNPAARTRPRTAPTASGRLARKILPQVSGFILIEEPEITY